MAPLRWRAASNMLPTDCKTSEHAVLLLAGGQAETQQGIARDRHTWQGDFGELGVSVGRREVRAMRPINGHRMAAATEFPRDDAEGHGDAVHFRRKGLGDEGEFHKFGGAAARGAGCGGARSIGRFVCRLRGDRVTNTLISEVKIRVT